MGRRGSISEEQVFEAADTLVAQGKDVTPTALLNSLGSGSFTTIYKHLSAWESSRASAVTDRAAIIPDAVLSAFGAAWRAATAEAGKEVLAVKEQSAEEVAAARTQFQEALQTIERLEAESEADAVRIESLSIEVAELEKTLHLSENDRSALKATCEQLQNQLKSLESSLAGLRMENELERKRHQEELAEAYKDKDTAIRESAELRGKTVALEAQNKDLLTLLSEREKR